MAYRTSIFIDFWNFSLQWRNRANGDRIDWTRGSLRSCSPRANGNCRVAGFGDMLHLEEALVYASYDEDDAGKKLKGWLDAFLDKQPRFRVTTRVRRSKPRSVYCRACEHSIEKCPHCEETCGGPRRKGSTRRSSPGCSRSPGKGAFDAALLVSSDTDYLPAVESLQARGFKVINATWANHGHELARACWASFELDSIVLQAASSERRAAGAASGDRRAAAVVDEETAARSCRKAPDGALPAGAGG